MTSTTTITSTHLQICCRTHWRAVLVTQTSVLTQLHGLYQRNSFQHSRQLISC
jgi:hypothetical protein